MKLWQKFEDAVRANINDLLDRSTDPVKELNLMVEDMHTFRDQRVRAVGDAVQALKRTEADLADANAGVARWGDRAQRAKTDEEKRSDLRQQIQQENLAKTLQAAVDQGNQKVSTLEGEIAQLDEKLQELESQKSIVAVRVRTAQAQRDMHTASTSSHGRTVDPSDVLRRVDDEVKDIEAQASGADEVERLNQNASPEARASASDLDDEVERRLASMRAGSSAATK